MEEGTVAASRLAIEESHRRVALEVVTLGAELDSVRGALEEREALRAHVQAGLAETRVALASKRSQHEALERLEREREGYGAGVRAIFADPGRVDIAGVVGTVADLLEVPAGLEAAVESVLGDRLQWVVVERFTEARAAVAYLERERAGSATFLPLETLPAANGMPAEGHPAPAGGMPRGPLGASPCRLPASRAPALPPRTGGDRRPPGSGRGPVASERRGGDLRHAIRRGALSHRPGHRRPA